MSGASWFLMASGLFLLPSTALPAESASSAVAAPGGRSAARDPRVLPVLAALAVAAVSWAMGAPVILDPVSAAGAWAGMRWLRSRPQRPAAWPELPVTLDLLAAALRAGQPLVAALALVAAAAPAELAGQFGEVAALLRLGAAPAGAWSGLSSDARLRPVVQTATRSAESGLALASGFERLADRLRAELLAQDAARAQRAGVRMVLPLAACFLPAFICVGVVPVVAGIAHDIAPALGR